MTALLAAGRGHLGRAQVGVAWGRLVSAVVLLSVMMALGLATRFAGAWTLGSIASGPGAARQGLGRYLTFYNGRRPHSSLDRQTPDQAYFTKLPQSAAA